ncbi:LysM peptidoglycan-binding domain-containing protein [Hymenobacter cavernae]|uniref:LysM domain-containing protein n=1 Tax=Hymenobacter cavernae TaxID=2044852 RepID=A0ABQ1TJS9_9BACT|nr:LysM peptidoglycan-binding domain-containing protein [Hymenobacter cavernae]GGE95770.1 hypothetical protein GCM10011383_03180 [Hymenobacter cavernae]
MKRIVLLLLCLLPLLVAAQSVTVPNTIEFAGLHLRLTDGGRRAVQEKVDALRRHQPSFQARVDLADAHFPLIDRVFQEEGIPLDFHFLSLQESGLQGDAQSIHDAVGYWQFKRESATELGVQVNDVVDERKHIVVSSHGAAKYLLRNNGVLHNWLNTLLTYNLGLTGTKPYTLPTDYNATEMEITQNTHAYILTFLAHKIAFEPAVGQNPRPPMQLQEFPAIGGQQLSAIAAGLQTEPAALARHNRWLMDGATVPLDRAYTILVPVIDPIQLTAMAAQQKVGTKGQLLSPPETDPENADFVRINGLRALVALPGDTKESLAKRGGLKMRKFMQFNDLMAFDNIVVGQPYFVQKKRDKAAVAYHAAQPGESVATVSQKYGIRVKAILNKNRMARNEELRPGRVLWLQHTRPREVPVEYAQSENTVAQAAFERPVAQPAAKPTPRSAAPAPASANPSSAAPAPAPGPRKAKDTESEPYAGSVAAHNRLEEDAAEEDSTTMTSGDLTMENLNELPAASTASDSASADTAEPASAPSSSPAPAPAPRTVYAGRPAMPASSAPAPTEEPSPAASATASSKAPTPKPAPTASAPKEPATVVLRDPAPAASAAATKPASQPKATPTSDSPTATVASVPTAIEAMPANGLYIVQKSEGLYAIARRYGLRPADLIAWNDLPPNPSLQLGQTLRLTPPSVPTTTPAATAPPATAAPKPAVPPASAPSSRPAPASPATSAAAPAVVAAPAATSIQHTVAPGESMYGISRKYKVTIKQIMEWNNKPDFNVRPGEVLTIQPAK